MDTRNKKITKDAAENLVDPLYYHPKKLDISSFTGYKDGQKKRAYFTAFFPSATSLQLAKKPKKENPTESHTLPRKYK